MHSEGILAGELKHGPLALVDKQMPVIMVVTRDPVYSKCMNALQQVIAREGAPVLLCEKGDTETQAFSGENYLEIPELHQAGDTWWKWSGASRRTYASEHSRERPRRGCRRHRHRGLWRHPRPTTRW